MTLMRDKREDVPGREDKETDASGRGAGGRQAGEPGWPEWWPRADRPAGPATAVTGTLTAPTQLLGRKARLELPYLTLPRTLRGRHGSAAFWGGGRTEARRDQAAGLASGRGGGSRTAARTLSICGSRARGGDGEVKARGRNVSR